MPATNIEIWNPEADQLIGYIIFDVDKGFCNQAQVGVFAENVGIQKVICLLLRWTHECLLLYHLTIKHLKKVLFTWCVHVAMENS